MTRLRLLAATATAAAVALALSACGTTTVADAGSDAPAKPTSADCKADTTTTSTDPVTITDVVGRTVKLDAPAKRVAVLEWQQIEDALTLCVTPVAVADPEGYGTWVKAETLPKSVKSAGTREEPDLDAIYAQKPDLIIVEAFSADDEKVTRLLKRDVPVLVTKGSDTSDPIGNMKNVFSTIAEATGRTERADAVLKQFDEHLAEAKTKVADVALPTKKFLFFDGWIEGGNVVIRPYGQGALFTALGEQLGLEGAWTDDIDKTYGSGGVDPAYGLGQTDIEGLTAVGDANLFYSNDQEEGSYVPELEKSPIWTALPSVKDGRAHAFPAGVWGAGGPKSNQLAIDAYVDTILGS
ncbi:siderophore ABC transporter substrate-binding protein CdtB [Schumannella luteola]|uniref:Iron complex transport system substrate-binding protein n=1 Tax=Schumannella luteola TaxID=472059 RepID=A0A852YGC6_9MICO|nr:iron-siderophore ABC transporter substrate-binding protein [Schumannella luteola]NYG98867.1 iron complex transport system substrate-binding protein [Schumannella luteola]TPX01956.1 iron-siderophore ABC transporter substrate-binding protein [Schumannella luteola]